MTRGALVWTLALVVPAAFGLGYLARRAPGIAARAATCTVLGGAAGALVFSAPPREERP